jgi:bifunctional non-homologous end joining protein LigD
VALKEYRAKRKLDKTPEPAGGSASPGQLRFVVQKHAASHLHYDFRVEMGGVLKSWAVPKGPSLNPEDKRLAMLVEDHPMDYRNFEGIIPKGNYGAGTVMVWDAGTITDIEASPDRQTAERNLKAGFHKGDLKFSLNGQKLKGTFVLAKMHDDDNAWLLIKKHDQYANKKDVTKQDRSSLAIAHSRRSRNRLKPWLPGIDIADAPKAAQPRTVAPMLATLAEKPFDNPDWIYEIKWDGYRILAHIKAGKVKLQSRNDQDYSDVFKPIHDELSQLKLDAILDGEVVVLDQAGRPDFGALQEYQKPGRASLPTMFLTSLTPSVTT